MALVDVVRSQMMTAMKAKDNKRKDALSALLAALKNGVINKRADLTPEEELAIVSREAKQAKETLDSAPAGRDDICEECMQRLQVFSEFLPQQMDDTAIRAAVESVLQKLGLLAPTPKEKGAIMKELMPLTKGKADGKRVNELLAEYLK